MNMYFFIFFFFYLFFLNFFLLLRENDFWEKSPVGSADIPRVKNFKINTFYAEIQDGRQKWWENNFGGKSPEDFADTYWIKNFIEIALSRSVSEKNGF